jgi:hypothetical protein
VNKIKINFVKPDLFLSPKIAIIGSSGKLKGSNLGNKIDQYDEVIRFNRAPTEGYENDVGSKTTLRVANSHVFANLPIPNPGYTNQPQNFISDIENQNILLMAPKGIHWELGNSRIDESCETFLFDWNSINKIKKYVNYDSPRRDPFAGTIFTISCVMSGLKPDLYGFDTDEEVDRTHYFGQRPPKANSSCHTISEDIRILINLKSEEKICII